MHPYSALTLEVTPAGAPACTSAFCYGSLESPEATTGLHATARAHDVLVVSGAPILLLWDFQDLAAIGPHGPLWHIVRLAEDDVCVTSATLDGVEGTGWFGTVDPRGQPFRVDVHSGEPVGIPTGWPAEVRRGAECWTR